MTAPAGSVGAHVSDLDLDRRAAATDAAERRVEVEAHLAVCARCAERWRVVQAEQAAFRARPLPDFLSAPGAGVTSIASAREQQTKRAAGWVGPAIGVLALAAVALLIARPFGTGTTGPGGIGETGGTGGDIRTKGHDATLLMSVVTPGPSGAHGLAHMLAPTGETVHPGDVLQWRVTLRAPRYVAVLSSDPAGAVNVYFPRGDAMPRVEAGEARPLGTEVELDQTLGSETIYALFCEAPESLTALAASIAQSRDAPAFPAGCSVEVARLTKTARP